jgi:hypothetical protein
MAARRMGRSLENRKTGSKQLPTILSRKRKSDEDDHSQPVKNFIFSFNHQYF